MFDITLRKSEENVDKQVKKTNLYNIGMIYLDKQQDQIKLVDPGYVE